LIRGLLGLCLLLLTGCVQPAFDTETAQNMVVRQISVDTSAISGVTGRQIAKSPATIDADLTAALRQSLAPLRPTGSVDVSVQVLKLRLFAPQEEIFIGGTWHIQALVRVTDVKTGRDVMSPLRLLAASDTMRISGPLGPLLSPPAEKDYAQTIDGFAHNLARRILRRP